MTASQLITGKMMLKNISWFNYFFGERWTMKNERDKKSKTKAGKKQREKAKNKPTSRSNGKSQH